MTQQILFEDKDVKITNLFVYIKWYYFPWGGTKKVSFNEIKKVEKLKLGYAKYRLWGMDASQWGYWLPGDIKRMSRQYFVGITIDSSVKPSFTSQNIDNAYKIIKQRVSRKVQSEDSSSHKAEEKAEEKAEGKAEDKSEEDVELKQM